MATGQLIESVGGPPDQATPSAITRSPTLLRLPLLIAGALLVVVLYAAFDHGAVALAADTRAEVAVAAIAAVAALAWLGIGRLRFSATRSALGGLGLLAAFAGWTGITLVWSVAPDQTWIELNRVITYVIVLGLAISIGASHTRARQLFATGFFAIALLVTLYALGQKLVPGLHVSGIFDLNQTGSIPRLQEPIGYWNALALFVVLAVPTGLHLAVDAARSRWGRLTAACALELMLLAIGLTLSRGGVLALVVAVLVAVAGARERLRALAWLALIVLATLPPLALGLTDHSLTAAGLALSSREAGGAILAAVLLGSLAVLCLAGNVLLRFEPRLRLTPRAAHQVRRVGLVAVVVLVVGGLLAAGLTHAWSGFTSSQAPSNVSPNRFLSTDSYRWLWWKEAAHAFAARPLGGWGAGSFGVVHLIYRHNTLPVQQPHSVPLQFLSETGIIGALLGLGALALLLLAAARTVRRQDPAERGLATALLAGAVAYLVHFLYDWDWSIPAVTLPALMFLGVLVGSDRGSLRGPEVGGSPGPATRALALTTAALWLCFFAISAILPSLAASKANAALIQAASSAPGELNVAQASARLASSLDPLSDAGLRAEASIAIHRGEMARGRYYLEKALGRDPSDELAWNELAEVDSFLGDRPGERTAARHVLALDPHGPDARAIRSSKLLSTAS